VPFNSIISRTDAAALIPEDAAMDIIKSVPETSAVMRLARRLTNMSSAQRRLPIMNALATAYFVSGDTGLKQTSEVSWANKYIDAEELAVIVPIPEAVLDDNSFDIWAEVRPALIEAFGVAVDQAVLYGTNIPASWTTNLGAAGVVALATAAGNTVSAAAFADLYEAIMGEAAGGTDGLLMTLESDGYVATGHVAHVSMRGKLRNTRSTVGEPLFKANMQDSTRFDLDGAPIYFPTNGAINAASSLLVSGQWDQLGVLDSPGHHLQDSGPGSDSGRRGQHDLQPGAARHGCAARRDAPRLCAAKSRSTGCSRQRPTAHRSPC
jgi:HK97 family phage major capsid protein